MSTTACEPCNARKGERTPEEAGMPLRWRPYVPTGVELHFAREVHATADPPTTGPAVMTHHHTAVTATTAGKEPDR